MRISEAGIGQEFTVKAVLLAREVGRRLADMGFTEGAKGKIIRRSFFHGPIQVRIRDYDVLIRRCEAAGIEVIPEGELSGDMGSRAAPGAGGRHRRWAHGGFGGHRHGGRHCAPDAAGFAKEENG